MYCDFFGIRQRPFEDRADTRFFHTTSAGEEALAMMEYECHCGEGTALLLGDAGTGKTLHVRMLLQRLHATDHVVVLNWPSSAQSDLIRETIKGFGLTLPSNMTASRGLARIRRHLQNTREADHRAILIVDQAENLTKENLAELATLADLQTDGVRLLKIVLSAQPQFKEALDDPSVARVRQQLFGERVLSALTPEETVSYILHRLDAAGAVDQDIFEPGALRLIYERSNGIARLINRICNAAMLAAYGAEQKVITESIIEEVTDRGTQAEKTISASELGLASNEQVAAGWSTQAGEVQENNHHGAADSNRAESVLARLENALDRAQRHEGLSQGNASPQDAVENHLHALIQEAYRVVGSLRDASDSAIRCTHDVEARMERARNQSTEQIVEFDQQLSKASEIAERTQTCLDGIADACNETDEVRPQLSTFAQELPSKADEVQSRISDLVSGMEMSEKAAQRLQDLLNREAALNAKADQRLDDIRHGIDESIAQSQQRQSQAVDATIEISTRRFDELIADHHKRLEQSFGQFQTQMREKEAEIASLELSKANITEEQREQFQQFLEEENRIVDKTIAAHRQQMTDILDHSEERFRALESLVDASREKAEVTLRVCQNAFANATKDFDTALEGHEHTIRDIQKRQHSLTETSHSLSGEIKTMEHSSRQMTQSLHDMEASIGALNARAEQTVSGLTTIVPSGEILLDEIQSSMGTLEGMQRSVATTLIDLGKASERYNVLSEQIHAAEEISARLAREKDASHSTVTELHNAAAAVHVDIDAAKDLLNQSATYVKQLEDQNVVAADAIQTIKEATVNSDSLVAKLSAANEHVEQLDAQQKSAQSISTALEEVIDCASSLNETFQGTIAHSDEKIGQLSSHHAAAVHVLGQLNDLTQAGHEILEEMSQSTQQATQSQSLLTETLEHATRNSDACRTTAEELSHTCHIAQDITKNTVSTTQDAKETLADLSLKVDSARVLKESVASAEELLLQSSQSQAEIVESTRNADLAREELVNIAKMAVQARLKLSDQTDAARNVTEDCDRARGEADRSVGQLTSQIEIAQRSLEGRESLLTDFVERTHSIEQQLNELQAASDEIENHVHQMTQRPSEILTEAREQASQLEKVCKAVRKVFAGLSKATLEAHQQTEESQKAGKEAFAHLSEVSAKTQHLIDTIMQQSDQSAGTLREWVTEAANVQARLERIIEKCPTIQQTHSSQAPRKMTAIPKPKGQKLKAALPGELSVLTEPRLGKISEQPGSTKGANRAQEIANLLEEAKRASAETADR